MQHVQGTDHLAKAELAYYVPDTVFGMCVTSSNARNDSEVGPLVPIFWGDNSGTERVGNDLSFHP